MNAARMLPHELRLALAAGGAAVAIYGVLATFAFSPVTAATPPQVRVRVPVVRVGPRTDLVGPRVPTRPRALPHRPVAPATPADRRSPSTSRRTQPVRPPSRAHAAPVPPAAAAPLPRQTPTPAPASAPAEPATPSAQQETDVSSLPPAPTIDKLTAALPGAADAATSTVDALIP